MGKLILPQYIQEILDKYLTHCYETNVLVAQALGKEPLGLMHPEAALCCALQDAIRLEIQKREDLTTDDDVKLPPHIAELLHEYIQLDAHHQKTLRDVFGKGPEYTFDPEQALASALLRAIEFESNAVKSLLAIQEHRQKTQKPHESESKSKVVE